MEPIVKGVIIAQDTRTKEDLCCIGLNANRDWVAVRIINQAFYNQWCVQGIKVGQTVARCHGYHTLDPSFIKALHTLFDSKSRYFPSGTLKFRLGQIDELAPGNIPASS